MSVIHAGERLNRIRKKRGLSLEEVALGVGVTSSHISQIENGKRQPSFNLLSALADFFDLEPAFFLEPEYKFYGQSAKVQEMRTNNNLSIEELAVRTGLSVEVLKQVEAGERKLGQTELEIIAKTLGTNIGEFYGSVELHLDRIREICDIIFNMSEEDIEKTIEFIRSRIRVEH